MEIRISVPTDKKGGIEIHLVDVDENQDIRFVEQKYSKPARKPKLQVKQEPRWNEDKTVCAYCGNWLFHPPTGRKKRFCNNGCRRKWWSVNRDEVTKGSNAQYEMTCECCEKMFVVYGNSKRKYCSRECYVNYRFWGGTKPVTNGNNRVYTSKPEITLLSDE